MPEKPSADALFGGTSNLPNADDLFTDGPQVDTSSADKANPNSKSYTSPVGRFFSEGWKRNNLLALPYRGAKAVGEDMWDTIVSNKPPTHTIDFYKGLAGGVGSEIGDTMKQGFEDIKAGHPILGASKMLTGGPEIGDIGEKVGEGDVAGALGAGTGDVVNAAVFGGALKEGGVGQKILQPLENKGVGFARRVYQGALRPNKWFRDKPPSELNAILDKGLEDTVLPNEGGIQRAQGHVSATSDAMDDVAMAHGGARLDVSGLDQAASLDNLADYNKNVFDMERRGLRGVKKNWDRIKWEDADPQEITAAKDQYAQQLNAKNVQAKLTGGQMTGVGGQPLSSSPIMGPGGSPMPPQMPVFTAADIPDIYVKGTQFPSSMTLKDLVELKQTIRKSLTSPTGRLMASDVIDSYANHLAGSANQIIAGAFPELKELGLQNRDWINLRQIIKEAASKNANTSLTGLSGAMAPMAIVAKGVEGASMAGQAAMLGGIIKSPVLRARLASMVYKASRGAIPLSDTLGRLGAIGASLDNQESNDQRNAAAINAK